MYSYFLNCLQSKFLFGLFLKSKFKTISCSFPPLTPNPNCWFVGESESVSYGTMLLKIQCVYKPCSGDRIKVQILVCSAGLGWTWESAYLTSSCACTFCFSLYHSLTREAVKDLFLISLIGPCGGVYFLQTKQLDDFAALPPDVCQCLERMFNCQSGGGWDRKEIMQLISSG